MGVTGYSKVFYMILYDLVVYGMNYAITFIYVVIIRQQICKSLIIKGLGCLIMRTWVVLFGGHNVILIGQY